MPAHPVTPAPAAATPPPPPSQSPQPQPPSPSPGRSGLVDAGMATAEYAIATLAACGFAGLLLAVLRGGEVRELLTGIVRRALSVG